MKDEIRSILEHMSATDIWSNIDGIMASGIEIDELIEFGEPSPGYFARHYAELLNLGVNPERLFRLNEQWHLLRTDWPEDLGEIFQAYVNHGLDKKMVEEWFSCYVDPNRFITKPEPFKHAASLPGEIVK